MKMNLFRRRESQRLDGHEWQIGSETRHNAEAHK